MARRTIFAGTFVHTPSPRELTILKNAAIFVDEAGRIAHIDADASAADARINSDLGAWSGAELIFSRASRNEFFFPGFVDTHIHASQYPNAGIFGKTTLLDWLEEYTFPLEASLADLDKARRVYARCIARTLANGTTTAAYYATRDVHSTNLLADLCVKAGQRAFVGRCNMDSNAPDYYRDASAADALRDTEATVAHCAHLDPARKLLTPIVTPRLAASRAARASASCEARWVASSVRRSYSSRCCWSSGACQKQKRRLGECLNQILVDVEERVSESTKQCIDRKSVV